MTVLHRVATYHGTQQTPQGSIYAYKTICGTPIATPLLLKQDQVITLGATPHAQCAKCFAQTKGVRVIEGDRPVASHTGDPGALASSPILNRGRGPIHDERGNVIPPAQESGGTNGTPLTAADDLRLLNIKETHRGEDAVLRTEIDDLGRLESNDFG